jgi:hypothetical protein
MDYKVMKRPMFKMGGPTSGGTGITSGLETPRQNFAYSTYGEAIQAIPAAFQKRRTGLENQMGSIGPMALYSAVSGGALENVDSLGDLAQAFGNPAVLQSVMGGLASKNKLQSSLDDVDLKEATTMATLLKPKGGAFSTRLKSQQAVKNIQETINGLRSQLGGLDPTADADKIASIKAQIGDLNQQMKVFISGASIRERAIELLLKGDNPSMASDEESIQEMIKIIQGYKEGGRINKAIGGGMDMGQEQVMPAAETTAPGPEMMPQGGGQDMGEDPFQILRARLPREIPDDVVSLIAYNKKAFADFANIQDQDDVDLFNQKYNVQLVVDLASR